MRLLGHSISCRRKHCHTKIRDINDLFYIISNLTYMLCHVDYSISLSRKIQDRAMNTIHRLIVSCQSEARRGESQCFEMHELASRHCLNDEKVDIKRASTEQIIVHGKL